MDEWVSEWMSEWKKQKALGLPDTTMKYEWQNLRSDLFF